MRITSTWFRPRQLQSLIGISPQAFIRLCTAVWVCRPDRGTGRPWELSFVDRMFLLALQLRTNLTERQLAALFGVGDATVHRIIATYTPHVAGLLPATDVDRRFLYVVDGTLVPAHDRSRTSKSKNYRRSVNVQVVAQRATRRIVAVTDPVPGSRHDARVFKESGLGGQLPGVRVIGDGGYQGVDGVTSPKRGPGNRIVRDEDYEVFKRKRATAEHVIARWKDWQVMRQNRKRGTNINDAVRATAVLYNLGPSVKTW